MQRFAIKTTMALVSAGFLAWSPVGMAGERTIYSDDGMTELNAPDNWPVRADIGRSASLRVSDPKGYHHIAVYTYPHGEAEPETLEQFAESFSADLMGRLEDGRMSAPKKLTINGRPALQYELTGHLGGDRFIFLSTTVEGVLAKHQLVATITEGEYEAFRKPLQGAILSFRESARRRPAKERIDLVFNWPEAGESRFTVQNRNTDRRGTHEMQMSGVTTVRPLDGEALLVSTRVDDFKITPAEQDAAKQNYLQNLVEQATSNIPDYVVSREGEFIRIENLGTYYGRVEEALLKGLPGGGEAQEKAKKLVQGLISEETLQASMQDEWNKQVYDWAGASYVVGENYTYETDYQLLAMGDASFPMTVSQRLTGRVPCHQKDKARACVQLVATSRVSGASFDQAMQQYLNKVIGEAAGDKAPAIAVEGAEIVKTVTLVTDPETLMPYEENTTTVKTTPLSVGGEKRTGKEVSESVTRYTY